MNSTAKFIIAMLVLVIAGMGVYQYMHETRTVVIDTVRSSNVLANDAKKLSGDAATREELQGMVDGNTLIVAAQLVATDFTLNSRKTLFFYSDDKDLGRTVEKGIESVSNSAPFFIYNDQVNNSRMIKLLGEEMYCYPSMASTLTRGGPLKRPTASRSPLSSTSEGW